MLSRSRRVTVASSKVRKSIVTANGTPSSSVRAYRLPTAAPLASSFALWRPWIHLSAGRRRRVCNARRLSASHEVSEVATALLCWSSPLPSVRGPGSADKRWLLHVCGLRHARLQWTFDPTRARIQAMNVCNQAHLRWRLPSSDMTSAQGALKLLCELNGNTAHLIGATRGRKARTPRFMPPSSSPSASLT